jgi:hypothetical protein
LLPETSFFFLKLHFTSCYNWLLLEQPYKHNTYYI